MLSKLELKELTRDEAIIKLQDNEEALMNLRFQLTLQQLDNPLQINKVKKEIAQLKTILREYELGKR
jgi:large subunit ribosomal protein L29